MASPHVSIVSAAIFNIGPLQVTNSVLASYIVTFIIILIALYVRKRTSLVPSRIQLVFEMITEFFLGMLKSAYGSEKTARKFFPLVLTLFLFLLLANQFSLLPLITSIVSSGEPMFRTPTSDWNQTIALALIVLGMTHILALSISPLKHIGSFIKLGAFLKVRKPSDLGNALLEFFLGILDIVGELAKIISISARLFGNIFAGEVMIVVVASISTYTAYLLPIPFIGLSMFSGFVQAFVFTLLTVFYMAGTLSSMISVEQSESHPSSATPHVPLNV